MPVRKPLALAALGAILLVAGSWFALRPRAFGWAAYTPLSDAPLSPGAIVLDGTGVVALLAAATGLALVAGVLGYLFAVRRR